MFVEITLLHVLSERYALIEEIGVGGFSSVFRARDLKLEREVAVKILKSELLKDQEVIDRFMSEAKISASLKHPNSLQIFDYGQGGEGSLYIVSEFLEGETLFEKISREGQLDAKWVLSRMRHLCMALEEAHRAHIIHRDLKPENIFIHTVGSEERLVIIDFGISKLVTGELHRHTQTGQLFGTPMYMSPEQITEPQALTELSDLYSLGVVIFHALAGAPPFSGDNVFELLSHHVKTPAPMLSSLMSTAPAALDQLIDQLLAKSPQDRPQSAQIIEQRLLEILALLPGVERDLIEIHSSINTSHSSIQALNIDDVAEAFETIDEHMPDTQEDLRGRDAPYPLWLISIAVTVISLVVWLFIIKPSNRLPSSAASSLAATSSLSPSTSPTSERLDDTSHSAQGSVIGEASIESVDLDAHGRVEHTSLELTDQEMIEGSRTPLPLDVDIEEGTDTQTLETLSSTSNVDAQPRRTTRRPQSSQSKTRQDKTSKKRRGKKRKNRRQKRQRAQPRRAPLHKRSARPIPRKPTVREGIEQTRAERSTSRGEITSPPRETSSPNPLSHALQEIKGQETPPPHSSSETQRSSMKRDALQPEPDRDISQNDQPRSASPETNEVFSATPLDGAAPSSKSAASKSPRRDVRREAAKPELQQTVPPIGF